jgi:endonuclease YncB( thermonuclease family)
VPPTLLAGLLGVGFGAVVMMLALPADLFGRVPALAGELHAESGQVAVVDGQTLRVRETTIRLQGVLAPPRGQGCRDADGTGYDCGAASSAALAALVRGRLIACTLNGRDEAGFPQALCEAGGADVNRALVAGGWARAVANAAFGAEELAARTARRGLWRGETPGF